MKVTARQVHAVVTAVALVAYLVLGAVQGSVSGFAFPFDIGVWAMAFGVSGWIITGADRTQGVGRVLSWAGTLAAVYGLVGQAIGIWQTELLALVDRMAVLGSLFALVIGQLYVVVMWLVVTAIAIFPEGRYPSRLAAWAHRVFTPALALQAIIWASAPSDDGVPTTGWVFIDPNSTAAGVSAAAAGFSALAIVVAVLFSMLRGGPVRRRQLGWVAVGVASLVGLNALTGVLPAGLSDAAGMLSFVGFPLGIVMAVTRYKLYEIDRIFSRTITYVVVVGLLVAVYFGLVLLLRSLLPVEGPLPVALSTLAVAFAFFPLARRVQGFVDRRFFRSRYDAASVVASFAAELRSTIDPDAVVDRAERVVDDVFAPESVGIWVAS